MLDGLLTKQAVSPEVYPLVAVTCGVHFDVSSEDSLNSSSKVQVHEPLIPSGPFPPQVFPLGGWVVVVVVVVVVDVVVVVAGACVVVVVAVGLVVVVVVGYGQRAPAGAEPAEVSAISSAIPPKEASAADTLT